MKIRSLLALIGLAISFAVPIFAQQKETVDPKLREAQAAFEKRFEEAYNNYDAAAVAACYADDAVTVTNNGPVYGQQDIEKYYEGLFQNVHISNYLAKADPVGEYAKEWLTMRCGPTENGVRLFQVKGADPVELTGYWSAIKVLEGDTSKIQMGPGT